LNDPGEEPRQRILSGADQHKAEPDYNDPEFVIGDRGDDDDAEIHQHSEEYENDSNGFKN